MDFISNRQLTLLRKLRKKKYREKEQLFIAEGERAVAQIINNGAVEINYLFFDESQQLWHDAFWNEKVPSALVSESTFHEISDTDNPQGVISLCKIPVESDIQSFAQKTGILLATDAIQDPGNLGTIIRTACWFGVQGILFGTGTVDPFHPKVVRSTAGATGILPHLTGDLVNILAEMERNGWQTYLLDADSGSVNISKITRRDKNILVIGNEGNGISEGLFTDHRKRVKISGNENVVESLNASVACSVALYEFSKNEYI